MVADPDEKHATATRGTSPFSFSLAEFTYIQYVHLAMYVARGTSGESKHTSDTTAGAVWTYVLRLSASHAHSHAAFRRLTALGSLLITPPSRVSTALRSAASSSTVHASTGRPAINSLAAPPLSCMNPSTGHCVPRHLS